MNPRFIVAPALTLLLAALAAADTHFARHYDLRHVQWSVRLDPDHAMLTGTVVNVVRPLKDKTTTLRFDCKSLAVSSVTVAGAPAKFDADGRTLVVHLAKALPMNRDTAVAIRYSGSPEAGTYFVPAKRAYPATNPVVYTQGEPEDNSNWIPTYDYPDDPATTDGTIDVPAGWFALSNGKLISIEKSSNRTVYHWKMDQAHSTYLISFVATPMDGGGELAGSTPVWWYVPKGLGDWGKATFGGTNKMVEFYSKLTGYRYPYAKFSQTVVPDYMFGGMENITAVTNTIGALHPESEKPIANAEGLILHELAHQWFGDTVTCESWSHLWLNEGFASFLPAFYVREAHGQSEFEISRSDMMQGSWGASRFSKRPMVSKDYGNPIEMFDGQAYGGGAARMLMLMDYVGEAAFWKGISSYLKTYQHQNVTTEKFFSTMMLSTGKNLKPFMKQWFYTAGAPQVTVSFEGDDLVLTNDRPQFQLDLPVTIWDGSKWISKTAKIRGGKTVVPLGTLKDQPLLVDPGSKSLVHIEYPADRLKRDFMTLYKASGAGARATLINQAPQDEDLAVQALTMEKLKTLRLRWVNRLSAKSADLLMTLAKDSDARMRTAAYEKLGVGSVGDASKALLEGALKTERSDSAKNTALRLLLEDPKAMDLAKWAWGQDSFGDSFRVTALRFFERNDKDLARAYCLQAVDKPMSQPVRVAAIGILGSLKDRPGEHVVFEALGRVVREKSFGARSAAIGALANYGDKAALVWIKPLLDHPLSFIRGQAMGAVARLGGN